MLRPRRTARGFNLVELMIGIAIVAVLMMAGLPNLTAWLQNSHIRNAAETLQSGLQLARAEALRRNATVRFQLVSNLTSGCALSTSGKSWVVSLVDATGACDAAPSETTAPQILQKKSGTEGAPNAVIAATVSTISFNGLGRFSGGAATATIDISNTTGGACAAVGGGGGPMRCLRVAVTTGGQVRMCDPAVDDAADPRFC